MLYAIGRNIMKYHRFLHHEIEKYEGKKSRKQLSEGSALKNPNKGNFAPWNKRYQEEEVILEKIQALKKHEFFGIASSPHIKG